METLTTTSHGTMQPILHQSLQIYSPALISSTCDGITTVKQSIEAKHPSLRRLANESDPKQVKALFRLHLFALDQFLKQKGGLTADEIELITDEVFTTYGNNLSFADINLIFRNAKLGRYGELYQQLSCPKIMSWFDKYVDEKLNTAEKLSQDKDNERMMLGAPRSSATVTIEDGGFLNYKLHLANNNYKLQEQ